MGAPLTSVMQEVSQCKPLTSSQRTSLMVFGTKPKKPNSLLPQDKRRISLLNSDFKVASGLEAGILKPMLTHTLSHLQLVAGKDRRIYNGIIWLDMQSGQLVRGGRAVGYWTLTW